MTQNRISIVTACMNREENLLKVIQSWLKSHADEIIIVDWSCTHPLHKTLKAEGIYDERIIIYRVEDEERWILTHAYNVGLKRASYGTILKLDNDHCITDDFFKKNELSGLDTRLGSWRLARSEDQAYINGAFLIRKDTLQSVGFFNEVITTYGWDDSYLHESLFANGAKIGHLCPDSIRHIEQAEESRTRFQKITKEGLLAASVGIKPTEFMNRRNMYLSALLPRQTQNTRQATYQVLDKSTQGLHILKRQTSPHLTLPTTYIAKADRLAFRDFYCWKNGMSVESTCINELEDEFIKAGLPGEESAGSDSQLTYQIAKTPPSDKDIEQVIPASGNKLRTLARYIPFMLSAYGHTDNTNKYQMVVDLSRAEVDELNGILPDWCRDKVMAVTTGDMHPERIPIDTSRTATSNLIGKLLLGTKDENHYFWAAFNCLKPGYKRCMYDFVETAGKPHLLLSNYYLNSSLSSELRRRFNPTQYLRALAAIFPARTREPFSIFAKEFRQRLINEHNSLDTMSSEELEKILIATHGYNLTLVTSLFKGLKYVVDYALNLRRMNLFARTEILIYVVPSLEAEAVHAYLTRFFQQDTNVRIEKLNEDPGLYECWNLGIRKASGKYVSNANADDRRGRYHSDYLIFMCELYQLSAASSALLTDQQPTYAKYSDTQNVWFTGMGSSITKEDLYIENDGLIESQNLFHCMPLWRKCIHNDYGYFDEEKYGTSCDWEYWLRCLGSGLEARLLDLPLGFYLQDQTSHNRRYADRQEREQAILNTHISPRGKLGALR